MRLWPHYRRCVICFGSGRDPHKPSFWCPECGGVGQRLDPLSLMQTACWWAIIVIAVAYAYSALRG